VTYDPNNIFAKILRKEIPCNAVLETEHSLAFHDVSPQAPHHILIIPKGAYISFTDFSEKAPAEEITDFTRAIGEVARSLGVEADGYRILSNIGQNGGQEVPHYHVHLLAGRALGPILNKPL